MLDLFEADGLSYTPRGVRWFLPDRIYLTKGWDATAGGRKLAEAIIGVYPQAEVFDCSDRAHNRVELGQINSLDAHYAGKRTLVLGVHKSAVRFSDEGENTCPNYWHFSCYGFCPFDCKYCYLAGTPGVKFSPTVKVFLNIEEVIGQIDRAAGRLREPTAFYLGKLQDGLALDPLTGYSRRLVPFFAQHEYARQVLLTKSADVDNLIELEHGGHTTLSWSLNPPEVSDAFEANVPSIAARVGAMQRCAEAGYPVRAVIMPIIPVEGWEELYSRFLTDLLEAVPLGRITLGQICSFPSALQLTEQKLGNSNVISEQLERGKSLDGRTRFPFDLRVQVYRHLIGAIRDVRPGLQIGLCLEEKRVFEQLGMETAIGCCNCGL
ncbi:MAG: hypothetical protein JW936_05670 [Sedimentisphaerales bacterium]|nr:hypothetical protein [Sedimentisphaerales bacterium]